MTGTVTGTHRLEEGGEADCLEPLLDNVGVVGAPDGARNLEGRGG